jgi:hypothetical protein
MENKRVNAIARNRGKVRELDFLNVNGEVEGAVGEGPVGDVSSTFDKVTPAVSERDSWERRFAVAAIRTK